MKLSFRKTSLAVCFLLIAVLFAQSSDQYEHFERKSRITSTLIVVGAISGGLSLLLHIFIAIEANPTLLEDMSDVSDAATSVIKASAGLEWDTTAIEEACLLHGIAQQHLTQYLLRLTLAADWLDQHPGDLEVRFPIALKRYFVSEEALLLTLESESKNVPKKNHTSSASSDTVPNQGLPIPVSIESQDPFPKDTISGPVGNQAK